MEIVSHVWLPTVNGMGLGYCDSEEEAREAVQEVRWRAVSRGRPAPEVTIRLGSLTADGQFVERSE